MRFGLPEDKIDEGTYSGVDVSSMGELRKWFSVEAQAILFSGLVAKEMGLMDAVTTQEEYWEKAALVGMMFQSYIASELGLVKKEIMNWKQLLNFV